MIILEGPNGCGKSTIGAVLHRALDCPYIKFPTPQNPADAVRNFDAALKLPDRLVLDRHPMVSDRIYAPVMWQGVDPIPWSPEVLEPHIVIYCRVPMSTAIRKHKYVKDDPFYRNELQIFASYDALFSAIPHIAFNWLNNVESELLATVKELTKWQD